MVLLITSQNCCMSPMTFHLIPVSLIWNKCYTSHIKNKDVDTTGKIPSSRGRWPAEKVHSIQSLGSHTPVTAVSTAASTGLHHPSPLHLLVEKAMSWTAKATWPSTFPLRVESLDKSDLLKSPADIEMESPGKQKHLPEHRNLSAWTNKTWFNEELGRWLRG